MTQEGRKEICRLPACWGAMSLGGRTSFAGMQAAEFTTTSLPTSSEISPQDHDEYGLAVASRASFSYIDNIKGGCLAAGRRT